MALLPARDIADRLGRRLDLPGAGSRDAPERQRTLQAAIGWSYDLLRDPERLLLERLSVFAGGFGVPEAEAHRRPTRGVGVDVLDGRLHAGGPQPRAARSVDHRRPGSGCCRRCACSLRTASTQRGDAEDIRRRHACRPYLAIAEHIAPHLPGPGQAFRLDRLAEEHDNLRAALGWSIAAAGEVELAQRFTGALWRFWQGRGHIEEGWATIQRVLAMPGADAPMPARLALLDGAGGIAWWMGEHRGR